jgi:Tfp pilus assembly protein PilO
MNEKTSGSALERLVLTHLRDPMKLRVALAAAILASWYFGLYSPMSRQMALTLAQLEKERKRIATAKQIESLRKVLAPFRDRVPMQSGPNELIQYVMAHVRQSPLKLVDLKPAKTVDLGPLSGVGLKLTLEATYSEIDAFLAWVENDRRMLRVDSLSITPNQTDNSRLNIQLDLLGLVEKGETPDVVKKPGTGGGAEAKKEKR